MESPTCPTAPVNSISGIQMESPASMLGITIQKPKSSPMTSSCSTPFSPTLKAGERTSKPKSDKKVHIPVSKIMDYPLKPLTVTMSADVFEGWKQVLGSFKQDIYNMCVEEWVVYVYAFWKTMIIPTIYKNTVFTHIFTSEQININIFNRRCRGNFGRVRVHRKLYQVTR